VNVLFKQFAAWGRQTLVPFVYYFFRTQRHRIRIRDTQARRSLYLLGFSRALSRYGDSRIGILIRETLKPLADANSESFPSDG
jgi:hypothetical protein